MKKEVYLDTTIPSYYYDDREETAFLIKATKSWFRNEEKLYEISISEETLVEAQEGKHPHKDRILDFLARWQILPFDEILEDIVQAYVKNHLMPQEIGGDALHLAYASYYKIDFLLTWNCNHLANANKREHIRVINSRMGLFVPEITTPLELVNEVE
jgi:predicted nucleic acid-binding protein